MVGTDRLLTATSFEGLRSRLTVVCASQLVSVCCFLYRACQRELGVINNPGAILNIQSLKASHYFRHIQNAYHLWTRHFVTVASQTSASIVPPTMLVPKCFAAELQQLRLASLTDIQFYAVCEVRKGANPSHASMKFWSYCWRGRILHGTTTTTYQASCTKQGRYAACTESLQSVIKVTLQSFKIQKLLLPHHPHILEPSRPAG